MNKWMIILLSLVLIGCSTTRPEVRPVEIVKNVEPVKVLHPPLPEGVTWEEVKIVVLTPEKMREILAKVESGEIDESDAVFAALTPDGYEHLAVNLAQLKRFIEDQKSVIMYYRDTVPEEIFLPKEGDEQ